MRSFCLRILIVAVACLAFLQFAYAQDAAFAPRQTFGVFSQYSPNSSKILVGFSRERQLITAGGEYSHKLFSNDRLALNWLVDARPLMLEQDLVFRGYQTPGGPAPTGPGILVAHRNDPVIPAPPSGDAIPVFSHRWSYAGGLDPIGLKMNFGTRHRLQPVVLGSLGFLIGTHDIPVDRSSAFNFVAQMGIGLEYFHKEGQSFRIDYRFHHYSNAQLGTRNPGVDSGTFQFTYSFGR